MNNVVPKIATIHDLSGYGRCSLTVISPILSALGCQICPIPTAILSNHPLFENYYFQDYTDQIKSYYNAWDKNNFTFDCFYSGFIGSEKQIDIIISIQGKMKQKNHSLITIVDPVMGDQGKLYKTFSDSMVEKMKLLISKANIITPNITEACLLIGKKIPKKALNFDTYKEYLRALGDLGPNDIIITGVPIENNKMANLYYQKITNKYYVIPYEFIDKNYPGAGDLFTALFVGYLHYRNPIPESIEKASRFISLAIKSSMSSSNNVSEGIMFEKVMKSIYDDIYEYKYYTI